MENLSLAGGELFLHTTFLGQLVDDCKQDLQLETVSIETTGNLVTYKFLKEYGHNLDILTVLCDSFDEAINAAMEGPDGSACHSS